MSLLAKAEHGGLVTTRTFIPKRVHEAIGVFGAVSVATACLLPGSVANEVVRSRQHVGRDDPAGRTPDGLLRHHHEPRGDR